MLEFFISWWVTVRFRASQQTFLPSSNFQKNTFIIFTPKFFFSATHCRNPQDSQEHSFPTFLYSHEDSHPSAFLLQLKLIGLLFVRIWRVCICITNYARGFFYVKIWLKLIRGDWHKNEVKYYGPIYKTRCESRANQDSILNYRLEISNAWVKECHKENCVHCYLRS